MQPTDKTGAYCTIDEIVREACLDVNDYGLHKYHKYLSWALEGLKEWALDRSNEVKTKVLRTTDIATLPFPKDMVKWSKIGTKEGDRIKVMIVNNKLTFHHEVVDCVAQNNQPYIPSNTNYAVDNSLGYYFYNLFWDGSYYNTVFGFGNGVLNDGDFRVDWENRRFQFSSKYKNTNIILEYITTGIEPCAESTINEVARKCIKWYIRWQEAIHDRNMALAQKLYWQQLYETELLKATKRVIDVDLDKIVQLHRSDYRLTPKT